LVTKKYKPLGAVKEKQGDFQIILATNYDLEKMVADGEMRQDFYDRFRGLEYTIPPLRERPEDVPILVDSLLKGSNYPDLELDEISLEYLISSLQELRLPNNVRGIEDILEVLEQESELIKPNPITPEIIEEIIAEKDSPTKHDDFATTVKQTVDQWTQTKDGKSGKKWWDGVLDTALNELLKSDEYLKNNGGLHYYKLSQKLGVDQKTIKNRIEKQTKSAL
jgi:transcriptional regulator with PAS, ATPase and Fis domain